MTPAHVGAAARRLELFRQFVLALDALRPYPYHRHLNNLYGNLLLSGRGRVFTAREIAGMWKGLKARGADRPVNLYLGTPFCQTECRYCIYFKRAGATAAELRRYAAALENQIEYNASLLSAGSFRHAYFGGGTPSLFTATALERICMALRNKVRMEPGGERAIEMNPASASAAKLAAAARFFNKLSLGVQSMDRGVLAAAGRRGQTAAGVAQAINWGRKAGFGTVSVDLLRGLYGDDGSAYYRSLARLLDLRPDTIVVYPVIASGPYLDRFFGGSLRAFNSQAASQERWFRAAADLARRKGYLAPARSAMPIASRFIEFHLAPPAAEAYSFRSATSLHSVLGLGHHANSILYGRAHYHSTPISQRPEENNYRGMKVSDSDEMRMYLLGVLSESRTVPAEAFRSLFGLSPAEAFPEEAAELAALGLMKERGGSLTLLPEDPAGRLACAMFFLDFRELAASFKKLLSDSTGRRSGT